MKTVECKNILIVEDGDALRQSLTEHFGCRNAVRTAKTLAEGCAALAEETFDAVILDLVLPDGNGLSLFDALNSETPVVILSDLGSDESILEGLGRGAADYLVKPVSLSVLEAKLALRMLPPKEAVLSKNGLRIDLGKRTVRFFDTPIDLTSSEFNILAFLMRNAGKSFSAAEIYEQIWQMPHLNTQTIRIHLHNLRKKLLQISDECGALIMTEFGKGYFFRG